MKDAGDRQGNQLREIDNRNDYLSIGELETGNDGEEMRKGRFSVK